MKTILLADYDASVCTMQKDILTQSGYVIVGEVMDDKQVVTKFKELTPNLTIIGFHPSEFDGIQAFKAIKSIESTANVIMCSRFCAHSAVVESIQLGAKDWVPIPFQPESLVGSVKKVLK